MQMHPKCFEQANFLVAKLTGQMLILKFILSNSCLAALLGLSQYV